MAFTLDALTFVVSAVLLTRVRPRERGRPAPSAGAPRRWQDLREGWREVRARPWVWVTIAAFTGALLCAYAPWYALAPLIARDHYGGVGLFGVLESLTGAGAVVGSLVALRWRPRRPMYAGLALMFMWPVMNGAFALGAPEVVMAVSPSIAGFGVLAVRDLVGDGAGPQHPAASAEPRVGV